MSHDDTTAHLPAVPDEADAYLAELHDDSGDAATWHQTDQDRHQVRQLDAADATVDHLAASPGKTGSVLVRDSLLGLGYGRAAHEHMEATRGEDERSIFAALCREFEPQVIEPSRVIRPGRRRKPPRGSNGQFVKGGAS